MQEEEQDETVGMMLRVPASLHARVKEEAATRGISMNKYVTDVLTDSFTLRFLPLRLITDEGRLWLGVSLDRVNGEEEE